MAMDFVIIDFDYFQNYFINLEDGRFILTGIQQCPNRLSIIS